MTLNANFAGARVLSPTLEGPERGLDALIGVVVLIAEVLVGFLAIFALYEYGLAYYSEGTDFGFSLALFGSGIVFVITTLIYLVRIARGRRSWTAPLWGTILISALTILGYFIMSIGV